MEFARICFFLIFTIFLQSSLCNGSDAISAGKSLFPSQTIVSEEGRFELGFFSLGNSNNSYVGIWYKNIPVRTVVWVVNRDNPINYYFYDSSRLEMNNGSLSLIVNSRVIWMSQSPYATEAVILDTGNLVLRNNASDILWQSFDYPTDTWLPGMLIGYDRSGEDVKIVSWRNENDPASGDYSLGMEPNGDNELFVKKNGSEKLWRSGIWPGGLFASRSFANQYYKFSLVSRVESSFFTYNVYNESYLMSRVVISQLGMVYILWSEVSQKWNLIMVQPSDSCKVYDNCGPNAICNISGAPFCGCLDGFAPLIMEEWDALNFSRGCTRMKPLQCDEDTTEFMEVNNITFPAFAETLEIRRDGVCEFVCRGNCSCTAYAYSNGGGCLLFTGDLIDSEMSFNNSGVTLYVRMQSMDHTRKGKRYVFVVALVTTITSAMIILGFCICYFRQKRLQEKGERKNIMQLDLKAYNPESVGKSQGENQGYKYELPIFSFSSIAASTNNFSITNKLGEGGFGPVYKAELSNEQFVAVKKLSRMSGQGLEEFKNEIELIAKLQHRNLVGILGCCVENEEKILVYEYMPNKSLDFFLFDPTKKARLSWKSRVHIIEGIAQGLLYLHHYSRLRIVHRDLKASNILLDAEMNPKISDFGMARIFRGDDLQANTKRIVGTYGYMSPEYAMEGLFSLKSDVFAFGVLMLEIISGKKNTGFYGSEHLSLLGCAWNMWQQERGLELVDPILEVPASSSSAAPRYIKIGLLCVQENPADRPLMSDVVAMLHNQETTIESPRHPAFTVGRSLGKGSPTQQRVEIFSANGLTLSCIDAR